MSFSQKLKQRSILPIKETNMEAPSKSTKPSKSFTNNFMSPKLNRLKNLIKNPVPKSQNKYKQFQDNDDNSDNISIGQPSQEAHEPFNSPETIPQDTQYQLKADASTSIAPKKEETLDYCTLNPNFDPGKDVSQSSLLTTLSSLNDSSLALLIETNLPHKSRRATMEDSMFYQSSATSHTRDQPIHTPNFSHTSTPSHGPNFQNQYLYPSHESSDATLTATSRRTLAVGNKHPRSVSPAVFDASQYPDHTDISLTVPRSRNDVQNYYCNQSRNSSTDNINVNTRGFPPWINTQLSKSHSTNAIMDIRSSPPQQLDQSIGISSPVSDDNLNAHSAGTGNKCDQTDGATTTEPIIEHHQGKYDPNLVDIEATEIMIENFEDHIKATRLKLKEAVQKRERNVSDLISVLSSNKHDKKSSNSPATNSTNFTNSSKKEFEAKHRSNEKNIENYKKLLDELEWRRNVILEEGIPLGVTDPKKYVKHLHTERKKYIEKRKHQKEEEEKQKMKKNNFAKSFVSKFSKIGSMKSASAENVSIIPKSSSGHSKLVSITDLLNPTSSPTCPESAASSSNKDSRHQQQHRIKSSTLDSGKSKTSSNEHQQIMSSMMSKKTHSSVTNNKSNDTPPHHKQNSAPKTGDSRSNSGCSVGGGHESGLHRKHSLSGMSLESGGPGISASGLLSNPNRPSGHSHSETGAYYHGPSHSTNISGTNNLGTKSTSQQHHISAQMQLENQMQLYETFKDSIIEEVEKRQQDYLEQYKYWMGCKLDAFQSDLMLIRDQNKGLRDEIEELNERIHKNSSELNQKITMSAVSLSSDLKTVKEKFDYQLELARRFLLDKVDSCVNNINLIEKRTEQLPSNKYADKGDMRLVTDHFLNLVVSFVAFFMLLLSSCFHLLIKTYNMGAVLSRYRYQLLLPLIFLILSGLFIFMDHPLLPQSRSNIRQLFSVFLPESWLNGSFLSSESSSSSTPTKGATPDL